ncbi:MAG: MFS transporter [Candidatus Marinimicrobia bacterium]|nr:MFS transporter [Candidatus Neomarinimicrobiota bacterium]MBT5759132.1 MFS transporter [Candidatus Neomarinimicrobiota bacterium]MBT6471103.1 MFS transporter [Candidatus Neomarinimicrobiota bacterium]
MRRNYSIVAVIFLTFFVISFLSNIIGPIVPDIIEDFELSLTLVAILPFAFFIAYGVMSVPSGLLIEKYGEKPIMISAFIVASFGSIILALFPSYITAIISLFFIGSGMAMLQVAINPLLRETGGEEHFAINATVAQLIFGVASFLSPLVYSYLVQHIHKGSYDSNILIAMLSSIVPENLTWISLYWLFSVISLLMVVIIYFSKVPAVELATDEQGGSFGNHIKLFKEPIVILFFFGIFTYVGLEQGVANWISEFLHKYHDYDPQITGAKTVSWFWGLMTIGGILGVILLKFLDSKVVLIIFTLGAMVSLGMALYLPGSVSLIAFPLVGFFSAVMYPIIFSLALNSLSKHHGTFSGILVTGIFGGAVVPLIVGVLGDIFGLRNGMHFLFIPLLYILSIGFWAKPLISNKTY